MLINHNKWSVNEKYVLPEQGFFKIVIEDILGVV